MAVTDEETFVVGITADRCYRHTGYCAVLQGDGKEVQGSMALVKTLDYFLSLEREIK